MQNWSLTLNETIKFNSFSSMRQIFRKVQNKLKINLRITSRKVISFVCQHDIERNSTQKKPKTFHSEAKQHKLSPPAKIKNKQH